MYWVQEILGKIYSIIVLSTVVNLVWKSQIWFCSLSVGLSHVRFEVWGLTLGLLYSDNLTCPHKVKSSRLYYKSHGSNKLLTVGIPFRIESYIFSPVPWKGNEPLRRMNSITPKRQHNISLHHITVVVYNTLKKGCIISAIICLNGTCIYINSTGNSIFLSGVFKDQFCFSLDNHLD